MQSEASWFRPSTDAIRRDQVPDPVGLVPTAPVGPARVPGAAARQGGTARGGRTAGGSGAWCGCGPSRTPDRRSGAGTGTPGTRTTNSRATERCNRSAHDERRAVPPGLCSSKHTLQCRWASQTQSSGWITTYNNRLRTARERGCVAAGTGDCRVVVLVVVSRAIERSVLAPPRECRPAALRRSAANQLSHITTAAAAAVIPTAIKTAVTGPECSWRRTVGRLLAMYRRPPGVKVQEEFENAHRVQLLYLY